jgi:Fic family protein
MQLTGASGIGAWNNIFTPELVCSLHSRLFRESSEEERTLSDSSIIQPGSLRSVTGQNVIVGNHDAPDATVVEVMLRLLQTDPRRQLIAAMAYHHRLAWVHPFADGNGRVTRLITHLQLETLGLGSGHTLSRAGVPA